MFQRISVTANDTAAHHADDAFVTAMAFDLNDATVDLDVIEACVSALVQRRHPTKLVARLIERAIETARQQRSAWP